MEQTPKTVAISMAEWLARDNELYQEDAVAEIARLFGRDFLYVNDNGNDAIDRRVLREFRRLTPDVVWERGERMWRRKDKYDSERRAQD